MPAIEITPTTTTETAETVQPESQVSVVKEVFADQTPWYNSNAIDKETHPPETLITEFSGYPWQGTYYGQVSDGDQALSTHQQGQLPIYQQYRKIEWLELLIQSPASPSSEALTQEMSYKLSARLYANGYLVPLEGDLFVSSLADGRAGIFAITQAPVRLSIFKNAVYDIELSLYALVADKRDVIDDIERKVVEHYVFMREYLLNGKDPFMTPDKVIKLANIRKELDLLERNYYREFYNRKLHTLILAHRRDEGSFRQIYDKELVELFRRVSRLTHEVQVGRITINGNSTHENTERACLMDLLYNRTNRMYGSFVTTMACLDSERLMGNPRLGGIFLSDLTHYTTPHKDKEGETINEHEEYNQLGVNLKPSSYGVWGAYETPVPVLLKDLLGEVEPVVGTPIYRPVLSFETYILSESFYNKDEDNYSTLERLVADYLNMGDVSHDKFEVVINSIESMAKADRFYLIPLILFMGRVLERSL